MAQDTEATERRILDAATAELAAHGPDGTTIEWIAGVAGVNKEHVYNHFGDKRDLLAHVLRDEPVEVTRAVPVESFVTEDVGEYAGWVYDYHLEYPEFECLLRWEKLAPDAGNPDDKQRLGLYRDKTAAVKAGQWAGSTAEEIDTDYMILLILSLAGWWSPVPQMAHTSTGSDINAERARRRESVVHAAHRIVRSD